MFIVLIVRFIVRKNGKKNNLTLIEAILNPLHLFKEILMLLQLKIELVTNYFNLTLKVRE